MRLIPLLLSLPLLALALVACGGDSAPAVAPGDLDLAYVDTAGDVRLYDVQGEQESRVTRSGVCKGANGLTWSPVGDGFACFWPESARTKLLDETGAVRKELDAAYYWTWSDTGRLFSYSSGKDGVVRIADLEGNELGTFEARLDTAASSRWAPVQWLRNDTGLLFADPTGHLFMFDLRTQEKRDLGVSGKFEYWSLGRQRLVLTEVAASGKEYQARVFDLDTALGRLNEVVTLPIGYGYAILSPDEASLALVNGTAIEVVKIDTREPIRLAELAPCQCDDLPGMNFSPEGDYLLWEDVPVAPSRVRSLKIVPVAGGEVETLADFDTPWAGLSLDTTMFAYMDEHAVKGGRQLRVVDLLSGETVQVTKSALVFSW